MPKETSANLDQINKMISGLTLSGLENVFRDPKFKKMFKDLTKAELKKLKIDVDVSGIKDVEELEQAFLNASGASEEYFRKLDKYRSTTKALNLAFREGSTHMREYLEAANKTGGRMAVVGAASTYLAKAFNEQIEKFKDATLAARQYTIEQDLFAKTSFYSKSALEGFRDSLSLTKKDMVAFYDTLSELETQGFGIDAIESKFKILKDAYVPESAKELMKSWSQIMTKLPTFAANSRMGKGPSTGDIYNMMRSGSYDKYLQIKYAGGKTEAAELSNHDKYVESRLENIKDSLLNKIPTELFDVSTGIGILSGTAAATLIPMTALMGSIQATLAVMAAKSGVADVANAASSGGFFGKISKTITNGIKSLFSKTAGVAVAGTAAQGLYGAAAAGGAAAGTAAGGAAAGGAAAGLASFAAGGAAASGAVLGAGLLTIGAVTEIMRRTFGKSQLGYTPTYKEMYGAVKEQGLHYGGMSIDEKEFEGDANKPTAYSGERMFSQLAKMMIAFEDRWDQYYQDMTQASSTMLEISIKSGKTDDYLKNIAEYTEISNEEYKNSFNFYKKRIAEINKVKARLKEQGLFGEEQEKSYQADISVAKKGMSEAQKKYVDSLEYILDTEAERLITLGGVGFKKQVGLRMGVSAAEVGVERAEFGGGEVAALRARRSAQIELVKSDLVAFNNINKSLIQRKQEAKTEEELAIIDEKLIKNNENLANAQRKLNDAIKDTSDIDSFLERLQSVSIVLKNITGYVTNVDGSFQALQPLMLKN